jgi:hypothetical protein
MLSDYLTVSNYVLLYAIMTNAGRSFCYSGVRRRQLIISRYVAKVYAIGLTSVVQLGVWTESRCPIYNLNPNPVGRKKGC